MKTIELFAGSKSFSKVAKKFGYETFTTDIESEYEPDLVADILDLKASDFPYQPDILWASPPCTFFSVASIGKHWNKDHTPKSKEALLGIKIVLKTLELIKELNPKYFFIENPRGKLRKMKFMQELAGTLSVIVGMEILE